MTEIEEIEKATSYKTLLGTDVTKGKRKYRRLVRIVHPDRAKQNGVDPTRAKEAFDKLTKLYDALLESLNPSSTKVKSGFIVDGQYAKYELDEVYTKGSVANLYRMDETIVKIPRAASSNKFIEAEREALDAISGLPDFHHPYHVRLVDQGRFGDREFNVLAAVGPEEGFYSLSEVRRRIPDGLDGRDYAWMHRRLLRALGGLHQIDWVHGAILPENVLIHPEQHGLVLAGYSFALPPGKTKVEAIVASQKDFYAPETIKDKSYFNESDVYMAHSLMRYMLNKNETKQLRFARGAMLTSPGMRPDVVTLMEEYDELLFDLYGKRKFIPFVLPK
jgi:serine/threonine protein kinase